MLFSKSGVELRFPQIPKGMCFWGRRRVEPSKFIQGARYPLIKEP